MWNTGHFSATSLLSRQAVQFLVASANTHAHPYSLSSSPHLPNNLGPKAFTSSRECVTLDQGAMSKASEEEKHGWQPTETEHTGLGTLPT